MPDLDYLLSSSQFFPCKLKNEYCYAIIHCEYALDLKKLIVGKNGGTKSLTLVHSSFAPFNIWKEAIAASLEDGFEPNAPLDEITSEFLILIRNIPDFLTCTPFPTNEIKVLIHCRFLDVQSVFFKYFKRELLPLESLDHYLDYLDLVNSLVCEHYISHPELVDFWIVLVKRLSARILCRADGEGDLLTWLEYLRSSITPVVLQIARSETFDPTHYLLAKFLNTLRALVNQIREKRYLSCKECIVSISNVILPESRDLLVNFETHVGDEREFNFFIQKEENAFLYYFEPHFKSHVLLVLCLSTLKVHLPLSSLLPFGGNISYWIKIFSSDDSDLVKFLTLIQLIDEENDLIPCSPLDCFEAFMDSISWDPSVVTDFLISNETNFLEYLVSFLKYFERGILLSSSSFLEDKDAFRFESLFGRLLESIRLCMEKDLFPYNASPLLKRLQVCIDSCSLISGVGE